MVIIDAQPSKIFHQPNLLETDLLWQLDPTGPLL